MNILTKSTKVKVEGDQAEPLHIMAVSSLITTSTQPTAVIPSAIVGISNLYCYPRLLFSI